jgi:hypothetical protein
VQSERLQRLPQNRAFPKEKKINEKNVKKQENVEKGERNEIKKGKWRQNN